MLQDVNFRVELAPEMPGSDASVLIGPGRLRGPGGRVIGPVDENDNTDF